MTIHFRCLRESDLQSVKHLHEELFPVKYSDNFYNSVVKNETIDGRPLYSCVAVSCHDGLERLRVDDGIQDWRPLKRLAQHLGLKNDLLEIHRSFSPSITFQRVWNKKYIDCDHDIDQPVISENFDSSYLEDGSVMNQDSHIVGVIVGAFTSIHDANIEAVRNLIRNPNKYSKLFYVMTLGTSQSMRRKGLSSALVKECMHFLHQVQDCGALYLHVITHNFAAIQFYEKLGFQRIEEIRDYYLIDGETFNSYVYAKFINGNRTSIFETIYCLYRKVLNSILLYLPYQRVLPKYN